VDFSFVLCVQVSVRVISIECVCMSINFQKCVMYNKVVGFLMFLKLLYCVWYILRLENR